MRATVNSKARFTVAFTVAVPFLRKYRARLIVANRKEEMRQVIDNIEFATVKLLSRAKSLKSLDATVNPP